MKATIISLLFNLFLLYSSQASVSSPYAHEEFHSLSLNPQNFNSISSVIYTPNNSSYLPILNSLIQNQRFSTTNTKTSIHCHTINFSKKNGIEMRIQIGGHDYEGLSYTSESPFFVVDMRNFHSITIDVEKSIAWVQAGATLGELYYSIAEKSRTLAFLAGVCPTVGVGGHFSGRGYGMLSRKHGIAIDHIIDARLVDVNGQILDQESMGEDLFWAIRGGGGASFGVIIEWKIKLVSVPQNVSVQCS